MKSAGAYLSTSDRIDSSFSIDCVEVVIDLSLEEESLCPNFIPLLNKWELERKHWSS